MKISKVPRDDRTPDEDALWVQWGVLQRILTMRPERPTGEELAADTTLDGDGEKIRAAVRGLVRVGLVHPEGELLKATRAAQRYAEMSAIAP